VQRGSRALHNRGFAAVARALRSGRAAASPPPKSLMPWNPWILKSVDDPW